MSISADDVMDCLVDSLRQQDIIGVDEIVGPVLTTLIESMCHAINKQFDDRERQFEEFNKAFSRGGRRDEES